MTPSADGDASFFELFTEYAWSFNVVRLISQAHFGGGQFSEIYETARRVRDGDHESWHREWAAIAERIERRAREAEAAERLVTARTLYLRASQYWRMADFMLPPSDERRLPSYKHSIDSFAAGAALLDQRIERVEIPYGGTFLPGYFLRGKGSAKDDPNPTVILFGGADSTAEELYFTAPGPLERGLSLLIVDGPGQGGALRLGGLPARFDYEVPVTAALDYATARNDVDRERCVLCAMSLGGYYAARAAAFEHRFAAVILWGACYDYGEVWADRPDDHPLAAHVTYMLGASDIREARQLMKRFTLNGVLQYVRTPTLILHGESDRSVPLSHALRTQEELQCERDLVVLSAGESGSAHCQQDNLTRANEIIWDWVLDTLGAHTRPAPGEAPERPWQTSPA